MKRCPRCKELKSLNKFNKHKGHKDGHSVWCRICITEDNRKWCNKNPKHAKEWRINNLEKYREYRRAYRKRYPEMHKATLRVRYAIVNGKLQKEPCSKCGRTDNVHGHHEDYSKPLDVVWLCLTHHAEIHGGDYNRGG